MIIEVFDAVIPQIDYFMLIMFRVGGLTLNSPIFGRVNVPIQARLGLMIALTYMFFLMFPQTYDLDYVNLAGFALIAVAETLIGVTLAIITNMFITIMLVTGHMIDRQIGFGIVSVFDIQNQQQIPITGQILNIMIILSLFLMEGHLRLIEIVALSIGEFPIGTLILAPEIGLLAGEIFARTFLLGIMIALPIFAAGLTIEVILGVLMRMVPQIHMFVVGIPLKMVVGLFVLAVTMPVFIEFSRPIFDEMFNAIGLMFETFRGA